MLNYKPQISGIIAYLVQDGLLSADIGAAAFKTARQLKMPQVSYLVRNQILSSDSILDYCIKQFGLPVFALNQFDRGVLQHPAIKIELLFRYHVLPLRIHQDTLYLGVSDPTDHTAASAISFDTSLRVSIMLVAETALNDILNELAEKNGQTNMLYTRLATTLAKVTTNEEKPLSFAMPDEQDEPVITFVGNLIQEAVEKNISDVHIETYEQHCRIRFRRDGLLYEAATLPLHLAERVTARIKIMAQLDIAERRLPQDGRIQLRQHEKIDMRVNTCPTLFGEKIVLRLLHANPVLLELAALGLTQSQQDLFLQKLHDPQGLILVTGPTGSGKTISLYAALKYLNHITKNICSVEDPVEIELSGVNQINTNAKIGLDFAAVLRTFLRQDPDIIMVGEVRDAETAKIALQAAQTGHLVLSTLHTNSAAETLTRLRSMSVDAYQLVNSISLVVAQRLVRKLCAHCKQIEAVPALPDCVTYQAVGCKQCHQGYHGRIGIFECLPMTKEMTELILANGTLTDISKHMQQQEWLTLRDAGCLKVKAGLTSYQELMRVICSEKK